MRSAIWPVRAVSGVKHAASVVPTSVIAWMLVIAAATRLPGFQRYAPGTAEAPPVDVHAACAPEANAEVNRGAGFLHLASTARARLAFDRAAAIDPDCAMAFWGRATSFLPATDEPVTSEAIAAGREAWERARALTTKTEWERGYLDALTSLYQPGRTAPLAVRVRDYAERLGILAKAHPDDDGLFVAWMRAVLLQSSLPDDEPRRLVRRLVVERFAGRSLAPGAAVVLMQAAEGMPPVSPAAQAARAAAERLVADPAISSPQALLMALRSFVRQGDWALAARAGAAAISAAGTPLSPELACCAPMQLVVDWLLEALVQEGRLDAARDLIHQLDSAVDAPRIMDVFERPDIAFEQAERARARWQLETADWRLQSLTGGDGQPGTSVAPLPRDQSEAGWTMIYARGLDTAMRAWPGGDAEPLREAREASAELGRRTMDARAREVSPDREPALAQVIVDAAIAASQDEHFQMALMLDHAIALETSLISTGQLARPLVPARELAAALWLRVYRYPDAQREARAALEAYPGRWHALLVLARASVKRGDRGQATDAYRRLLRSWQRADPGHPGVQEAQEYVAGPGSADDAPRPEPASHGLAGR